MNAQSAAAQFAVVRTYATGLAIVTFNPVLRDEFRRLNVAWLERYFKVEPIDERVLSNPEQEILAPGGEILFALLDGEVVGTVALKLDEDELELTKMAVDERWQGRGYGQCLLETALDVARARGKRRVVLYTQTALKPAIALYYKNGFRDVAGCLTKYARCDVKMAKVLAD
ncbi:MAG TPA: GNAT family N-acetyltransferase [Povalibacter sp.]